MKIKTDVSSLLVNYCRPPARQIAALSRLALDRRNGALAPEQQRILFEIQDEVTPPSLDSGRRIPWEKTAWSWAAAR